VNWIGGCDDLIQQPAPSLTPSSEEAVVLKLDSWYGRLPPPSGLGVDSSLTSTPSSIVFAFFPLSFLGPTFSFLFPMCVSPTFYSAQSIIDGVPVICLNVRLLSSFVTILFGIGVSLSVSSSSSSGSAFEQPIIKIRQVWHKYDVNIVTWRPII
jgi:hypothetical protein